MKIKEIIGVGVGKLFLDARLHLSKLSAQFENSPLGIEQMVSWVEQDSGLKRELLFFIFEHTGLYSYPLAKQFTALEIAYRMEPGLAVKRSLGITRGKNDSIDAKKLALYGYRLRDELTPYQLADKEIQQLQSLLKLRDRLVRQRAGYKASLKEQKRVLDQNEYQLFLNTQQVLITEFSLHIKKLVNMCAISAIQHDTQLKAYYQRKVKQGKAKMSVINAVRNKNQPWIFSPPLHLARSCRYALAQAKSTE